MWLHVLCKNIQNSAFVGADITCNSIHNARNEQYETQNTSRVDGLYFLYRLLCFFFVQFVFKAIYVTVQRLCSFRTVIQPPSRIAIERLLALILSWPVNVFGREVSLWTKDRGPCLTMQ